MCCDSWNYQESSSPSTTTSVSSQEEEQVNDLPEMKIWNEQSPAPSLHPNPSRFFIQRLDSLILRKRMSLDQKRLSLAPSEWSFDASPAATLHKNPSRFMIQRLDSIILKKRMSTIGEISE